MKVFNYVLKDYVKEWHLLGNKVYRNRRKKAVKNFKGEKLSNCPNLYVSMLVLFFTFGFVTILNDLLVPIFKEHYQLGYFRALLVEFVFFATYFFLSLPASKLLNRLMYKKTIVIGLITMSLGALFFIPANSFENYELFLLALFILASGVVILQVTVNPLVFLLGSSKTSSARMTLAHSMNSLGTVSAPLIVAAIISKATLVPIYVSMAVAICILAWFITTRNFEELHLSQTLSNKKTKKIEIKTGHFKSRCFLLSVLAIFFYVGNEVSAGSLVVSFSQSPEILNSSFKEGSFYLSGYWGLAMIGRLIGTFFLTRVRDSALLVFSAICNVILVCFTTLTSGAFAFFSLIFIGLFNSIMFPVIFSIGLSHFKSEYEKNRASGYLNMAIAGGAIIPVFQGILADAIGLHQSFWILIVGYCFIAIFSFLHLTEK